MPAPCVNRVINIRGPMARIRLSHPGVKERLQDLLVAKRREGRERRAEGYQPPDALGLAGRGDYSPGPQTAKEGLVGALGTTTDCVQHADIDTTGIKAIVAYVVKLVGLDVVIQGQTGQAIGRAPCQQT
jgi:hypothetical protein